MSTARKQAQGSSQANKQQQQQPKQQQQQQQKQTSLVERVTEKEKTEIFLLKEEVSMHSTGTVLSRFMDTGSDGGCTVTLC